ncbi:hypothetical protein OsJ_14482 [Oryza sativa Japonica Group]|uniref:Uncharacterized protein n=1 Tax=Oryza sativa subsp. japonica TaxID=39947 RepID=B9FER8_ORYSJ|nr:hypothetical protein OsJ_14482 [Oryza sativa Japonica Group]
MAPSISSTAPSLSSWIPSSPTPLSTLVPLLPDAPPSSAGTISSQAPLTTPVPLLRCALSGDVPHFPNQMFRAATWLDPRWARQAPPIQPQRPGKILVYERPVEPSYEAVVQEGLVHQREIWATDETESSSAHAQLMRANFS